MILACYEARMVCNCVNFLGKKGHEGGEIALLRVVELDL